MVRVGVWEAVYRIQGLLDWDGRPVISAIKTDILRCAWRAAADRGGRRRSTRVLVVGWIATNFFVVNISARSVMGDALSAWVVLTGPREGSHHRWPVSGPCGGDACTWM